MKIYFVLLRFSSVSLMAGTARQPDLLSHLEAHRLHPGRAGGGARGVGSLQLLDGAGARVRVQGRAPGAAAEILAAGSDERHSVVPGNPADHREAAHQCDAGKVFVETLLFFVNFAIQRMFIFKGREAQSPTCGPAPAALRPGFTVG
jgi:hypothetical protein